MDTSFLTFDYLDGLGACIVGDPRRCVEIARRYEAAGCDLLLCLVNPYDIPHEKVMRSIELIGRHVIPELR
jgi:alkanesulfonate monooxygenase SsuD/methylene tetrahydromethanopterin reductase-like flavin-dependent oxidoreductase (luciferase family)